MKNGKSGLVVWRRGGGKGIYAFYSSTPLYHLEDVRGTMIHVLRVVLEEGSVVVCRWILLLRGSLSLYAYKVILAFSSSIGLGVMWIWPS